MFVKEYLTLTTVCIAFNCDISPSSLGFGELLGGTIDLSLSGVSIKRIAEILENTRRMFVIYVYIYIYIYIHIYIYLRAYLCILRTVV